MAHDADSKDFDNFYVTGGDEFQSGAWLITNKSVGLSSPPDLMKKPFQA